MNKFAFLVPFYNHPQNIKALITALKTYELPVVVVDDGSDEASKQILAELERTEGILLLTRAQNGGKGIAMKDGFKFASERGFSHVLQIDADFQHDAALIGEFLRQSEAHPQSIVCANPIYGDDAPKSRVHGRKITNFWVAINTLSLGIKDAMCGFRVYPLEQLKKAAAKSKTNRMEFDIEILVNAARQGVDMRWIDTYVHYEKGGVSHFKMLRDNALISLMHAKYFFSLPKFMLDKIWRTCGLNLSKSANFKNGANDAQNLKKPQENSEQNLWWKKQERGGAFFLRLSLFLAQIFPEFALKLIVKIVVWFYYIFSKNERENIAEFRRNLSDFAGSQTLKGTSVFSNFEAFGVAICDKFRVWKGKIKDSELEIIDLERIKSELIGAKKGQILLTAHLGNVEICKALGARVDGFRMVILAYDKNSREFNEVLKRISQNDGSVRMMLVNELDVAAMLELKNIVESGEHIGIMGDRTPIGGDKAARVKFLGKEANFNYGPYLIAGILGVKISSLWCQKIEGKFRIELVPLASTVKLGRDKAAAVREYLQIYVRELENRCKQTPVQWFNFFDFWR
ncbi:glycosyltransferase family 2 protein [Campylobacter showae]|uniref:Glycosyl transferase / Lysophospholipid acyltransferase n=1 Tax=Campylobacter showae CSUNSWCD TaxID=1244083 RepID=M5IHB7_9BACT|nr:glycosyltransferase family 2 protein [Campylobacter showae]EKU10185.1 Glycosyl transferase / Lysophospholipid acyltransferase [Campylobacter showae CSUNSWCD]